MKRIRAFNDWCPKDPVTVDECIRIIKDGRTLWNQARTVPDLVEYYDDAEDMIYLLANVGGAVISCINNGGFVDVGVRKVNQESTRLG